MSSRNFRRILAAVGLIYFYFIGGYLNNPMTNSIADLTIAMVDENSIKIDKYAGNSLDVSRNQGSYYSGMPPGLSVLMVPVYLITKIPLAFVPTESLERLNHFIDENVSKKHGAVFWTQKRSVVVFLLILSTCLIAIPLTLFAFKIFVDTAKSLELLKSESKWIILSLFILLGTPLADFTATLYHNTISALLLWIVFGMRVQNWRKKTTVLESFLFGIALGFCPTLDYPAVVYSLVILLFVIVSLRKEDRKLIPVLGMGYLTPVAGLLIYHQQAFGSFFANAYQFRDPAAGPSTPAVNAELAREGLFAIIPTLPKLYRTFFHPWCSILIYNPLLVIGLGFSVVFAKRSESFKDRVIWGTIFLICFSNFWFFATLPMSVPPYVGSFGARYTLYSVFFSALCLAQIFSKLNAKEFRISVLTMALATIPAWLYFLYGSPHRTVSEYLHLLLQLGPANYTLTKLYEAHFITSPLWAWLGFGVLVSINYIVLKSSFKSTN
jgi:hypothetical protein